MKKLFLVILAALILGAASVYAADSPPAGEAELKLLEAIFTGNIGLTLGLFVAITGIFAFVKGNAPGGIFIIVLGVLITLLPGIYNGMRLIVCPIATSLGGHCNSSD